jgi:hypothetical protein
MLATEYVLWGTAKGSPSWAEEIITTAPSKDDPKLAKARAWAEAQGFTNIRLSCDDGTPPDFAATVRI